MSLVAHMCDNCDAHFYCSLFVMNISSILMVPRVVMVACGSTCYKTIPTMELIRARRVTVQICILYKPENSVILLSANLGLERRWIRRKTKDYLLHRALGRQIFQQKSKVMLCNVWTFPPKAAFPCFFFEIDPFHVYVNEVELEDKTITRSDV